MTQPVTLSTAGSIAVIEINNPPVNALSQAVRQGLLDAVVQADADAAVTAIVILGAGRSFPAGADIKEFGQPMQDPHLPDVIDRIESCSKPVVAALHGTALGGGFEIALGSHYRIAVPSARVACRKFISGSSPAPVARSVCRDYVAPPWRWISCSKAHPSAHKTLWPPD